ARRRPVARRFGVAAFDRRTVFAPGAGVAPSGSGDGCGAPT
ncbi:MAG: hypothetical protein AVDCRST_MAG85-885, partial [uncultured Solirubrobacteraceae bacterium]